MGRATLLGKFIGCALIWSLATVGWAQLDQPGESTASWIGLGQPSTGANQWFAYRKSIDLAEDPSSAVFDIATDSKYWLWINGEQVVFEGGLKRGPTPTDSYFDRVDVTPYLKAGDNTVALLHWYFGREGFSHKDSGTPGFILDGRIDAQTVVTDDSWRVTRHDAYGTSSAQSIDFRLPESNIRFSQSLDIGNWQLPTFDDSGWEPASELGSAGSAPWNGLVERNTPQWKDFGKKSLISDSFVSDGQQLTYDLPYQAQFTPYFKIAVPSSASGQTVTMLTETNGLSQTRGEYVTVTGQYEYESYGWMSGEELRIQFPDGVTVLDVGYRETGFDSEFIDYFVSDDSRVNSLMDKSVRTLYVNMRDNFFDTPDRERAAWWGDIVNELGQAFYALDKDAHSLIRKSVLNLADWSRPDGTLFSPVPAGNWNRELPMQMLASVGEYGFGNYYRHTGDVETLSHVYPKVNDYVMNVWQLDGNGLVDTSRIVESPTLWAWFDWGTNIDRETIANSWYYLALMGQREQALATGNNSDVAAIDQRMQSISANFDTTFWDETVQAYRSKQHGGCPADDRANALAVLAGLAPESRYDNIRGVLVKQEQASPFIDLYVAEALGEMGFAADGLLRLRRRYEDQINADQSTLGELFNGGGTKNHAWNAPLKFFAEQVTGIKPIEAGYTTYQVRPNFAGLNAARQHVDTVKGPLNVNMKRTDAEGPTAGYELSLLSPAGSQANISLPSDGISSFSQVRVNGQVVYDNGAPTDIAGFTYSGMNEGRLEFQAAPGQWDIEVVGQQAGYFSTRSWQSDADLPLDSSKTYTHAIDFLPGGTFDQAAGTTTIGGVAFTQESVGNGFTGTPQISGQDISSGAGWSISGIEFAFEGNGPLAAGVASEELSDGLVAGGDSNVLELTDLAPNTDYVLTWYSPLWDANSDRVAVLDGGDDGFGQGMTIAIVQDADAELLVTQYRYNTGNSTSFQMQFSNITPGQSVHHYAFTNELAPELNVSLPFAPGDANGDGLVDIRDFELISDNFLNNVALGTMGDVTNDGVVNAEDYRLWQANFVANGGELGPLANVVPEPATNGLLVLASTTCIVLRQMRHYLALLSTTQRRNLRLYWPPVCMVGALFYGGIAESDGASGSCALPDYSTAGFFHLNDCGREVFDFNIGWRFHKGAAPNSERIHFDDSKWNVVNTPHGLELTPAEASGSVNYQGEAWYRKHFSLPPHLSNRRVVLHFEAAMGKCKVWLNGQLVHSNYGGYLPFEVNLAEYVNHDQPNVLAVWVDNSDDATYPPGKEQSLLDFTYFGGIYRDVWLIATNSTYITSTAGVNKVAGGGVFIRYEDVSPAKANVVLSVDVKNEYDYQANLSLEFRLKNAVGDDVSFGTSTVTIDAQCSAVVTETLQVEHPRLWHPNDPHLYDLELRIANNNGKILDGMRHRVGIRKVEFRGKEGLYLNGEPHPTKLIGGNRHQDHAYVGNALPNSGQWRDAMLLKEAGMDLVRAAHYPADPAFMDACDALGLFFIEATPGWQFWGNSPQFEERVYSDIRSMVRRDRNRPSVLMWEPILNESSYPFEFAKQAHNCVHEELPFGGGHTVCDGSAQGSEHFDVIYSHPFSMEHFDSVRPDSSKNREDLRIDYRDEDRCVFTREFGDAVDDWNSHNSPSRCSRQWGEHPQLVQAKHYANPPYVFTSLDTLHDTPLQHLGGALWHSFDHQRGYHPDPFYGGLTDAFRQTKYAFHLFKSQRAPDLSAPMVFIAHEMTPFSPADVPVFTNCDSVRLTIYNRRSLVHNADSDSSSIPYPIVTFEDVFRFVDVKNLHHRGKATDATIVAEGLIDGRVVATHVKRASLRPAKISLELKDFGLPLVANGSDIITVVATITDEEGTAKRLSNAAIEFSVTGEGHLVGDASIMANPRQVEWGTAPALIRSTRKAGDIRVVARPLLEGAHTTAIGELTFKSVPMTTQMIHDDLPDGPSATVFNESPTQIVEPNNVTELRQRVKQLEREVHRYQLRQVEDQQGKYDGR